MFYKGTKAELLELRHDSLSRPILFDPKTGEFEAVRQDYDRFGHLSKWEWGTVSETYDYDKSGRLSTVRRSNVTLFRSVCTHQMKYDSTKTIVDTTSYINVIHILVQELFVHLNYVRTC